MAIKETQLNEVNVRVNTVVGLKQYQHTKQVMTEFESALKRETSKNPPKVDQRIP